MEVSRHIPVMSEEVLLWLVRGDGRTYLDCTVGYSGHAEKLLEASGPGSRLVGFDCDAVAIAASREKLARFGDRALLLHGHFMDLKQHLAASGVGQVDGILFDLGVSSPQLDEPARGFSFQEDGPLDMRMDPTRGRPLAELLDEWDERALEQILFTLGEERFARNISRAVLRARRAGALHDTAAL